MKRLCQSVAALAAITAFGADAPPSSTKGEAQNSDFQNPVRLRAADAVIRFRPALGPLRPLPP